MLRFPPELQSVISLFSVVFRKRVWKKAQLLLLGAICCPGSRTVCNVLRSVGLTQERRFHKYHRFLSKDNWSGLELSRLLLTRLVARFVPADQPLVFGLDETLERRWGRRIKKLGIFRDAVQSSGDSLVSSFGLRWMCLMLLTPLPWLQRGTWALPVLSALCPSERYGKSRSQPRPHKTLTGWATQMLVWLSRYATHWARSIYVVGDGAYATYELLGKAIQLDIGLITRLRLDARLFHFPPPPVPGKPGPKPKIGKRILKMDRRLTDRRVKWTSVSFQDWYGKTDKSMLITSGQAIWSRRKGQQVPLRWVLLKDPEDRLDPVVLVCTHRHTSPIDIVRFFVRRWRMEVTFAEVRRHLGVETQRQWSDLAIERTTPLLMGLMSTVCLLAKPLFERQGLPLPQTTWYAKTSYTFSDVLTAVRLRIWSVSEFCTSPNDGQVHNLKAKVRYLEQLLTRAVA